MRGRQVLLAKFKNAIGRIGIYVNLRFVDKIKYPLLF